MRRFRASMMRVAGLIRRNDGELSEELESNLQMQISDNVRAGMSPEEARRQALIRLGGIEQTKEAYRDQRGLPFVDTLIQDIRYALRGLRRSPGFAITAVLTLALGIGATAAIFSAVYALLIRPLPYRDADRLVWVTEHWPRLKATSVPSPDLYAWRENRDVFDDAAGYAFDQILLSGAGETARLSAAIVTTNFLSVLGVSPQLGRDFGTADHRTGAPAVVMLSDSLWEERFSSDPRVIGTAINLDGKAFTVIGVLPRSFRFPDMFATPKFLVPFTGPYSPDFDHGGEFVRVIGRLKAQNGERDAEAKLRAEDAGRIHSYPTWLSDEALGRTIEVMPLQRHWAGDSRTPLLVLMAAVGMVLLIACANIANLQLVRAASRRHEIAVRGALGARRGRLVRQFLTESAVVSAFAAAAGVGLGTLAIDFIRGLHSAALPWLDEISLDAHVLAFTLAIAVLAALLFGAAPAVAGSRADPIDALKATSLRMSGVREHRALQDLFVIGEIALALVLLISAGLLVRSSVELMRTDPGYAPDHVITAKVQLPARRTAKSDAWIFPFERELLDAVRAIPGVRSAALADSLPLQQVQLRSAIYLGPMPSTANLPATEALIAISPEFFQTMGTPLLAGRDFTAHDDNNAPAVAIVNRTFAAKYFAGAAVGRTFHIPVPSKCGECVPGKPSELHIVGIATDVRLSGLDQPTEPAVYIPLGQSPRIGLNIVVAGTAPTSVLSTSLRAAALSIDADAPIFEISTLEQELAESLAQRRLMLFLLSAFAALALLLAAIGVYGVISYTVVRRTQEIGIRMAMGAKPSGILRLVLGQQLRTILLGSAIGLALGLATSGLLASLLYGVRPHDPATFLISCAALLTVALLASLAPTWRAMRTNPMVALRYE